MCVGCIIISTVAYVAMKASVQSEFLAVTVTLAVAIALCVCAWQIFTQLENMVPKSERERIKAEKLAEEQAEEARKQQLAGVQSREVSHPEPPQTAVPRLLPVPRQKQMHTQSHNRQTMPDRKSPLPPIWQESGTTRRNRQPMPG